MLGYNFALQVSEKIQSLYNADQFDVCVLIYNKFKSAIDTKSNTTTINTS